ncbi:MAG: multiheme c-type cytochrome [Gemmataceae bacterium]
MAALTSSKKMFLFTVSCALVLMLAAVHGQGEQSEPGAVAGNAAQLQPAQKWSGAAACIRCHTSPSGNDTDDFVLLTEYATWKTQDKHALAYLALVGPRGQQMAKLLKKDVTKKEAGCLGCHSVDVPKEYQANEFNLMEGVSCDGCHGPSSQWLGPHQFKDWRLKTAVEKKQLGMNDVRDPATRAQLCMSCHVGNPAEGKVVTHAMYAAGHPPLPSFELAHFSAQLPPHWRAKKDVPFFQDPAKHYPNPPANIRELVDTIYHLDGKDYQQTQLTVASSLIGLKVWMDFVQQRSNLDDLDRKLERWPELAWTKEFALSDNPEERWPELALAQSNCYGCHHDLRRPSWRQLRDTQGRPGLPRLTSWPVTLPRHGLGFIGFLDPERDHGATKDYSQELQGYWKEIDSACVARPFGDPAPLAAACGRLGQWSAHQAQAIQLQDAKFDRMVLLRQLSQLAEQDYPDYDSARQLATVFRVIYAELPTPPRAAAAAVQKMLTQWEEQFHLRPYGGKTEILRLIRDQLKVATSDKTLEIIEKMHNQSYEETLKSQPENIKTEIILFYNAVSRSGQPFTRQLIDDADFLRALERINNANVKQELDTLNRYDPVRFKQQLQELAGLLAGQ